MFIDDADANHFSHVLAKIDIESCHIFNLASSAGLMNDLII